MLWSSPSLVRTVSANVLPCTQEACVVKDYALVEMLKFSQKAVNLWQSSQHTLASPTCELTRALPPPELDRGKLVWSGPALLEAGTSKPRRQGCRPDIETQVQTALLQLQFAYMEHKGSEFQRFDFEEDLKL
jgi:hypothetical protein